MPPAGIWGPSGRALMRAWGAAWAQHRAQHRAQHGAQHGAQHRAQHRTQHGAQHEAQHWAQHRAQHGMGCVVIIMATSTHERGELPCKSISRPAPCQPPMSMSHLLDSIRLQHRAGHRAHDGVPPHCGLGDAPDTRRDVDLQALGKHLRRRRDRDQGAQQDRDQGGWRDENCIVAGLTTGAVDPLLRSPPPTHGSPLFCRVDQPSFCSSACTFRSCTYDCLCLSP